MMAHCARRGVRCKGVVSGAGALASIRCRERRRNRAAVIGVGRPRRNMYILEPVSVVPRGRARGVPSHELPHAASAARAFVHRRISTLW